MTDETIVWLPSRQQCKDVSSLDARIVQASRRSIVVGTTDYAAATTLVGGGRLWSPYDEDPARHRQLREEYRTKFQKRNDRIVHGRVEAIDQYMQQKHTGQLRDQQLELQEELQKYIQQSQ